MSRRNRVELDRELEQYLDDITDEVMDLIEDQEDHVEDSIARININENKVIPLVAKVFEYLVFEEKMDELDAVKEASQLVIDTVIFTTLEDSRRLKDIDKELEDDLYDAKLELDDILRACGGGRRDRGRRSSSRREAASSRRDDRDRKGRSRRNRDEDNDRSSRRKKREDESSERKSRREARKEERTVAENKVEVAQTNIESNKETRLTLETFKASGLFGAKNGIAPAYWIGDQIPQIINNELIVKEEQDVEWEKHRTDLYLKIRGNVKPSVNVRKEAIRQAINSRKVRLSEIVETLIQDGNVVQLGNEHIDSKNIFTVIGESEYYGDGQGLSMLRNAFNNQVTELTKDKPDAIVPKFSLSQPMTATIRRYPLWVFDKQTYKAMKELVEINSISQLAEALIKVSNVATPEQWAYVHDITTNTITEMMRICIGSTAYLDSILVEWNSFITWLEKNEKGAYIKWVEANISLLMQRAFNLKAHGEVNVHPSVDGSDKAYGSTHYVSKLMYLPLASDHLGLASPTKLGRVLESVTPSLYTVINGFLDSKVYENLIVTESNEVIRAYGRFGAIDSTEIYVGELA